MSKIGWIVHRSHSLQWKGNSPSSCSRVRRPAYGRLAAALCSHLLQYQRRTARQIAEEYIHTKPLPLPAPDLRPLQMHMVGLLYGHGALTRSSR